MRAAKNPTHSVTNTASTASCGAFLMAGDPLREGDICYASAAAIHQLGPAIAILPAQVCIDPCKRSGLGKGFGYRMHLCCKSCPCSCLIHPSPAPYPPHFNPPCPPLTYLVPVATGMRKRFQHASCIVALWCALW